MARLGVQPFTFLIEPTEHSPRARHLSFLFHLQLGLETRLPGPIV